MTKLQTTQPEQPVAPKEPLGTKAIDAARTVIRQSMRYQSGPSNLKAMKNWIPAYLCPTKNGNYVPLTIDQALIGHAEPTKATRPWILPKEMVERVHGLPVDDSGNIHLFHQRGAPWQGEFSCNHYMAVLAQICDIDRAALFRESCRPQPRMFGTNTSIFHD